MSDLSQVAVYSDSADIYKVREDGYNPSTLIMFVSTYMQSSEKVTPKNGYSKNVFCNPAFELEEEREERVEGYRTSSSTPEPIKPSISRESGKLLLSGTCALFVSEVTG